MLLKRLPGVVVSINLAMAGILAIGAPLVKAHVNHCGLSAAATLSWWAIYVLGASAGGLLLYVYHAWAVRRGFVAWSALPWGADKAGGSETALSSPPWRRLWLWIPGSFVALVAGIALGVVGSTWVDQLR
jgi:hypothetical protein